MQLDMPMLEITYNEAEWVERYSMVQSAQETMV